MSKVYARSNTRRTFTTRRSGPSQPGKNFSSGMDPTTPDTCISVLKVNSMSQVGHLVGGGLFVAQSVRENNIFAKSESTPDFTLCYFELALNLANTANLTNLCDINWTRNTQLAGEKIWSETHNLLPNGIQKCLVGALVFFGGGGGGC